MKTTNNFKQKYTMEDLETLLDNVPEELWIKNENGNIIYANKTYCKKIGLSKKDILGKTEFDFRDENSAKKCFAGDEYVLKNNKSYSALEVVHINGENHKYNISKFPIKNIENYIGGMASEVPIIDKSSSNNSLDNNVRLTNCNYTKGNSLTNIKDSVKIILQNTKRLFDFNSDKSKYNYKYDFFTNVSHELKTPINIILATTQLILKSMENQKDFSIDEMTRYMNSIKQNSFRLLRLVNNILDSAKISDGYYTINLSNQNIVSIIEDIVMSTADYIKGKNKNIVFDTDEEEIILACDPDKIERIVLNLLSNALKYTDDNGNIEVLLKKDSKNNTLMVHVKNDGAPISNEDCHKIFNRFIQSDNSKYKAYEGSGIGLSLSKSLVELHGGRIWATPDLEKGAEFVFSLPIQHISKNNVCTSHPQSINSKIEKCVIEFSDVYSI